MEIVKDIAYCPRCKKQFEWSFLSPSPQAVGWGGKLESPKNVKRIEDVGDRFTLQLQCQYCNCRFPMEKIK